MIPAGPAHITERVYVTVPLTSEDDPEVRDHYGHRLAVVQLSLEYVNGRLWSCSVRGPKIRADGHPFIDGSYGGRSYMIVRGKARGLSAKAPEWVRDMAQAYAPDDQPVRIMQSLINYQEA